MKKLRSEQDRRSWKIRFSDETIGICYGTHDGAAEIADLRKNLYGGDYTVEEN